MNPEGDLLIVACLENAEAAVQSALDATPLNTIVWDDYEDSITDAAYDRVEQIRRLLDVIEQRLLGERRGSSENA
jgi:hypothetical protein